MKTDIQKIVLRLFVLMLLLVGMNYVYKILFFKKDLHAYSADIALVEKVIDNGYEIVYLGESSNHTCREDDTDRRKISQMISDFYPTLSMGDITRPAVHAEMYYEYLRNIPENSTVKTVIVTLNLRSFGADWIYSKLETPLQKSIILLKDQPPLYSRFLLSFKGYDIKTEKERGRQVIDKWEKDILQFPYPFPYSNTNQWDKAMATEQIKNDDGSPNQTLTELACHYIKSYGFQIDTLNNPRIKDFDRIVSLAKERNWNLILNLMAENTERANELIGEDLLFLMRGNRDLLINRYSHENVWVVDNLECVPNEQYIDQDWTTEHYAEKGRGIVARNVAECLRNIYPEKYTDIPSVSESSTEPTDE